MRVTNVNSQSFTGFKLKADGARVLAEKFVNNPDYEKVFMRRIAAPLKNLKTDVIFDGKDVFGKSSMGKKKVTDFAATDYLCGNRHSVYEVFVKRLGDKKINSPESYFIPDGGKGARKVLKDSELTGIPEEFLAAKQIALYEDDVLYSGIRQHINDKSLQKFDNAIENKTRDLEFLFGKK